MNGKQWSSFWIRAVTATQRDLVGLSVAFSGIDWLRERDRSFVHIKLIFAVRWRSLVVLRWPSFVIHGQPWI